MIYYLSLGSNVGNRLEYLQNAVVGLNHIGQIKKKSFVYSSEPIGDKNQAEFFNAVVKLEAEIEPNLLLKKIKQLEENIGRTKTYRWGPREIDIDIIEYSGPEIDTEKLAIPHIQMEKRKFVLLPLLEIEKGFKTRTGQTIDQILLQNEDKSLVTPARHIW
ncbi:MAG: 2-amino-4-hydroxy-6-hydroxymethyldihydropteridine diphosphokinase [Calditrichaeota bacterium]|nr:MAG: 2-amino-4-hydroxy-6-hydroxymethyldihydropteridine diphosphokinase [Calditrichota bacterium]MBL1206183.1 2-amino-4-hydroxy-6-hydroxymethyldihydropteridine diphosphokinase [Calditrichota bacterium]NOG46008.1 2-amino-4-hydroxy-6-hydroxymethyldihydropteridine diphosphokinase [Calditrichota bacterium]